MKFFITGGIGFVGKHLSDFLLKKGHHVVAVGLRPDRKPIRHEHFHYISADTTETGPWQEALADVDAVVNLAGKTIFKRWTKSYKESIYNSRILTTRNLVASIPQKEGMVLVSTSATGYYGSRDNEILSENASGGDDFLAMVGRDWEAEALKAEKRGVRVVVARFGIVLDKGGGAMAKMVPAFKLYVGGPLGSGMQWFPWIHMYDLLSAIEFVLEKNDIRGAVNFCSPNPVRNKDLAKALGRCLNRPSLMPTPAFMLRLAMGEFGGVLLSSQRAVPEKLMANGFTFQFAELESALQNIIGDYNAHQQTHK
jgi:uncharacterized protein (TIGR01777 family)